MISIGSLVSHPNAPGKFAKVLEIAEGVAKVAYEHKDALTGAITAVTHGNFNLHELTVETPAPADSASPPSPAP